ncbi:Ankyrin repeat domain-containing protein [Pararobbsia alpina]
MSRLMREARVSNSENVLQTRNEEFQMQDHARNDTQQQPQRPELDDETIEFATKVFDLARAGDAKTLGALLAQGLPPNLRNEKGDSLVMLASYHGHVDAVRVLLEHDADPDLRNNMGQTPIAGAAFKGNLPMIELLLTHGADIEGASPDGRTALMMAAMFNRTEIVDYLVAHGANVSARDSGGHDAAASAARMGAPDTPAQIERLQRQ